MSAIEPRPPRTQDPPPQPHECGPFVAQRTQDWSLRAQNTEALR